MAAAPYGCPDWRDEGAYRPLLQADRATFAWEWLRRSAGYRAAARAALAGEARCRVSGGPGRWGLHAFDDPRLDAPAARPVWRADRHPHVLELVGRPGTWVNEAACLDRLMPLATRIEGTAGVEHWLLSDGLRSLRIDWTPGGRSGLAGLACPLGSLVRGEAALLALRRLVALARTGRFAGALYRPERRAPRWIAMLRARDALAAGASQRDIAERLLGREAGDPRWRIEAPSLRSRVQRLVRSARMMAEDGYESFLS